MGIARLDLRSNSKETHTHKSIDLLFVQDFDLAEEFCSSLVVFKEI